MLVLRCTQKLLARLKQADNLADVESTTRLGDWYGNILQLGRRQHLLFISERSRLPVVIPIREGKRLAEVFPDAVCEVLGNVGVAAVDIADERSRMLVSHLTERTLEELRSNRSLGRLSRAARVPDTGIRTRLASPAATTV